MAGPPLMTSSNVDTQKEKDKAEEQPCPKRRRTSIDDSNNSEEQVEPGHEAAGGAPAEGDGAAAAAAEAEAEAEAVAAAETLGEGEQDGDEEARRDGARESEINEEEEEEEEKEEEQEEEEEDAEEEEEEEEEEEGEGESEDRDDLGNGKVGGMAETAEVGGEGGAGAAGGGAPSPGGEGEGGDEDKPDGSKIARARSAWMLFLADNREGVRKEHPGLAVGPMQKILSAMWKGLGEDEVARYAKLAVEDKERMKNELAAAGLTKFPAKNSSAASVPGGPTSLVLPLARVRKAVRLDPSVGNISKEGLLLMTKATEVFMSFMADHAWKIGRQTGRKSIRPCDVADFVFAAPEMYWLKDEFREERSSVKKRQSKPEVSGARADQAKKAAAAMPKGAKPITSFFQKA